MDGEVQAARTSSGHLAGPRPRPGLQSSSKLMCCLCEGSNSGYICCFCRLARKRDKAARKSAFVSIKETPAPCEHPAQTDCSERECKTLQRPTDMLKTLLRDRQGFLQLLQKEKEKFLQKDVHFLQEKGEWLRQAIRQQKTMEDAVRETLTLKQKLQEKDSGRECLVCLDEFGDDPSRQRAHYSDCNHANTCFGCAMKMWNRGKNKCPCCNTPATLFPLRLPAKIFL